MNQSTVDHFSKLVNELLEGIDNGDFSQEIIPDKYTWEHLLGLIVLKDSLDGAEDLFAQLYDLAISSAEKYLTLKAAKGEAINIAFQSYSAAQWPAEDVYRRFEKETNVNVKIVVSPLVDRNIESALDSYKNTLNWFANNGYNVQGGLNLDSLEKLGWDKLGGYPDVLYQLSSWFSNLPASQWFTKLPLRCLIAYIPYGIYMANNADGSYAIEAIYNKEINNLMWRVYCDSKYNLEGYKKYQLLAGKNVRYSGYAKMDCFFDNIDYSDEKIREIWKIPESKKTCEMKKIIIAPHYSIYDEGDILFSTFKKNIWFWLYLAEKYQDEVTFIFKPHPNLRMASVENRLFKSYEEYDEYIDRWNRLPNGRVVQEADYLSIFKTSDAMIMDSVSFLAEYLYTGKPLLFLTREEQTLMEIGERVRDSYYKTSGERYSEIERFINDVVIGEVDPMEKRRKDIFAEEYDYLKANGITASEYICKEVLDLIRVGG